MKSLGNREELPALSLYPLSTVSFNRGKSHRHALRAPLQSLWNGSGSFQRRDQCRPTFGTSASTVRPLAVSASLLQRRVNREFPIREQLAGLSTALGRVRRTCVSENALAKRRPRVVATENRASMKHPYSLANLSQTLCLSLSLSLSLSLCLWNVATMRNIATVDHYACGGAHSRQSD
jgi:hypothetical protein